MADPDKVIGRGPSGPRNTKVNPTTTSGPTTKKKDDDDTTTSGGMSAAEKRAVARENKAKKAAADKYLHQAGNLTKQADALRRALRKDFKKSRDQNLGDIELNLTQILTQLKEGFSQRAQTFLTTAEDTTKATADTAESGLSNLVRERADSLTAIIEQGAGETDALRAMVTAARNWHANASESNRAYYDTLQSVNAGIVDLNVDTKTSLGNAFMAAEGQREQVWQDYYNRRAESFTQLGNTLGQKADYLASAKEMGAKVPKKRVKSVEKNMADAWKDAAKEAGKSYKQKGLPPWITDWQGQEQVERRQENTNLAAALTVEPMKKAQGATLRKWAA